MDNLNLVTQKTTAQPQNLNVQTNVLKNSTMPPLDIIEITVNAFKDIASCGENSLFLKNISWLNELPLEIFNYAKYIFYQEEPDLALQFERKLPQLQRICPEINILRQTTPFSQMKYPPALLTKKLYQQVTDKNNYTPATPVRKHELPLGIIYSRAANGSRKEINYSQDTIKMKPDVTKNNPDFAIFNYDYLYPDVGNI